MGDLRCRESPESGTNEIWSHRRTPKGKHSAVAIVGTHGDLVAIIRRVLCFVKQQPSAESAQSSRPDLLVVFGEAHDTVQLSL